MVPAFERDESMFLIGVRLFLLQVRRTGSRLGWRGLGRARGQGAGGCGQEKGRLSGVELGGRAVLGVV